MLDLQSSLDALVAVAVRNGKSGAVGVEALVMADMPEPIMQRLQPLLNLNQSHECEGALDILYAFGEINVELDRSMIPKILELGKQKQNSRIRLKALAVLGFFKPTTEAVVSLLEERLKVVGRGSTDEISVAAKSLGNILYANSHPDDD